MSRATLDASYTDATTDLGLRYVQGNASRAVDGHLDKRFEHSTLGIGGDYL